MTPDPPSLTTVPDADQGRRTFTRILIAMCLLTVAAFGFALFKVVTRERTKEEIAREHVLPDYRFAVTDATEKRDRTDIWYKSTDPRIKPGEAVEILLTMNPSHRTFLTPPKAKTKTSPPKPLRRVEKDPGGETYGVEYDTKRRLYHVWWQAAP